jgi:hypothetical protein
MLIKASTVAAKLDYTTSSPAVRYRMHAQKLSKLECVQQGDTAAEQLAFAQQGNTIAADSVTCSTCNATCAASSTQQIALGEYIALGT